LKKIVEYLPKNWKEILGWLFMTTLTVVATLLGAKNLPGPTPPPVPIWEEKFGWHSDPEAVKELQGELKFPVFADTPAGKSLEALPDKVYLWEAHRRIDIRGPPTKNQNPVGSCVSFGTNNAILRTLAVQIAIMGFPEELKDICEEVTYAGSRVEVGKGRIRGDGSVGAWAAKFVKDWGVVSREVHGTFDLTSYNPTRCRSWGQSGVPAELETLAREHPVKEITLVQNWEQAKKCLASGYGIAICSNYGFESRRDQNGVKQPRGNWSHCMALDGYHTANGREYGHIENSWGARPDEGPVGWGNPTTAGFWADSTVVDRMLKAGDSWAFSAVKGFPARQIDWFVLAPRPKVRPAEIVFWSPFKTNLELSHEMDSYHRAGCQLLIPVEVRRSPRRQSESASALAP
jgi:hypothetical protein